MRPIEPSDIVATEDYEIGRAEFRKRLIAVKRVRRIRVGEHLTLLFENRDTMIYQIQEMMRVEKITEPKAIKHEIETYNELVPGTDELTATLLIEYEHEAERDVHLRELLGLENHVALRIDGSDDLAARFDLRQMSPERISSVHYIKFVLGPERAAALKGGATATLVVDHPAMNVECTLDAAQAAALIEDLAA